MLFGLRPGIHPLLLLVIVALPTLALVIELRGDAGIIERHHSHHDTYLIPRSITSSLMLMMLFVGVLGLVVGWLCEVGVFAGNTTVVCAFFVSFLLTTFAMWLGARSYRVVTFDDHLLVRDIAGFTREIAYADITRISQRRSVLNSYPNLRVYEGDKFVFLWGLVDLDQILLHIDRFDLLTNDLS